MPISREAFDTDAAAIQRRARARSSTSAKLAALWRVETLAASLARGLLRQPGIRAGSFPDALGPIAHMGLAIAAVERCGFDAVKVRATLTALCEPRWIGFAYESVGTMLALYERDRFYRAVRALGRVRIVPLVPLERPDVERFAASFDPESVRLLSHGYGRFTYFKSPNAPAAIRAARKRPSLDAVAWTQGVAFAHAYVNSRDLPAILDSRCDGADEPALAVRRGQAYALTLLEWFAPGFLDGIPADSRAAAIAIGVARSEITISRARGFLKPFTMSADMVEGSE